MGVDAPAPQQGRTRLNVWAILLGSGVDQGLSVLGSILIKSLFGVSFVAALLFGLAMTSVGGHVAAAVADRRSLAHSFGVGVLSTLVAFALQPVLAE